MVYKCVLASSGFEYSPVAFPVNTAHKSSEFIKRGKSLEKLSNP